MREEDPANGDEACRDNKTKGPSAPESKESVAQQPKPDGWFQSFVIGPIIARCLMNPFAEVKNAPKPNLIYGVVFCVVVCVLGVFETLDIRRNAPAAALAERELDREFRRIQAPTPSCLQRSDSKYKSQLAYVGAVYDTTLTFAEVREHYDVELASQGWKYLKEGYWGRRITRCYTKGVYGAEVAYEEGLFGGRTFSMEITWGFETCH